MSFYDSSTMTTRKDKDETTHFTLHKREKEWKNPIKWSLSWSSTFTIISEKGNDDKNLLKRNWERVTSFFCIDFQVFFDFYLFSTRVSIDVELGKVIEFHFTQDKITFSCFYSHLFCYCQNAPKKCSTEF